MASLTGGGRQHGHGSIRDGLHGKREHMVALIRVRHNGAKSFHAKGLMSRDCDHRSKSAIGPEGTKT
jgi:hypothetical protein